MGGSNKDYISVNPEDYICSDVLWSESSTSKPAFRKSALNLGIKVPSFLASGFVWLSEFIQCSLVMSLLRMRNIKQWLTKFNVHINHLEIWLKYRF